MIEDHYLIVQRWIPNFDSWKVDLQCQIAAWILLPDVPFEFYNVESLRRIGNMIGRMIKVDRATSIYDKGGFACICVKIDLQQPLLPSYTVFGEERSIIYEGLHQVCFRCGRYGHRKDTCSLNKAEDQPVDQQTMEPKQGGSNDVGSTKATEVGGGATIVTGDVNSDASPFRRIQILRREPRDPPSTAGLRSDINGGLKQNGIQRKRPDIRDLNQLAMKKDLKMESNGNKVELTKDKDPPKSEWMQVGAKRKILNKGKSKGKESRKLARDPSYDSSGAHVVISFQENSFGVLQSTDSLLHQADDTSCVEKASHHSMENRTDAMYTHARSNSMVSSTLKVVSAASSSQCLDDNPMQQVNMDEHMFEQDKTKGEVAIPQSALVSQ
ncbi:hypothetical protein K1719_024030 [Acacia pycnantha]|nr:hypothetical protein K1719_024030 [Acacia pycnantha]